MEVPGSFGRFDGSDDADDEAEPDDECEDVEPGDVVVDVEGRGVFDGRVVDGLEVDGFDGFEVGFDVEGFDVEDGDVVLGELGVEGLDGGVELDGADGVVPLGRSGVVDVGRVLSGGVCGRVEWPRGRSGVEVSGRSGVDGDQGGTGTGEPGRVEGPGLTSWLSEPERGADGTSGCPAGCWVDCASGPAMTDDRGCAETPDVPGAAVDPGMDGPCPAVRPGWVECASGWEEPGFTSVPGQDPDPGTRGAHVAISSG